MVCNVERLSVCNVERLSVCVSVCLSTGLAYVGTVCDLQGRSVSVVEDDGASVSEATAAHELGHR